MNARRRQPPIGPAAAWAVRAPIALRLAAAGCAALALAGCSGGISSVYDSGLWVQPGKYDFLKCPQLAQQSVGLSAREKELVSLMDRANQSAAGPVVNFMVYDADLQQVRAELALVQRTAREKGCDNLVPGKDPRAR